MPDPGSRPNRAGGVDCDREVGPDGHWGGGGQADSERVGPKGQRADGFVAKRFESA